MSFYPNAENVDELRDHNLMDGDDFLREVARRVRAGEQAGPSVLRTAPPWLVDTSNDAELGTANAEFCSRIDTYLRHACLVKMFEDGDVFDPVMFGLVHSWVEPEIQYFLEMAAFTEHPGLMWTADKIRKARACIS
jgi:hypothetical protein